VITVLVDPAGSGPEFRAPPTNNSANGGALFCYENADLPLDDGVSRASVVATARPAVAGIHTVKVQVAVASRSLTAGSPDPQAQAVLQATSLTVMR
jgi:hypothetical protein